jgi:hypothetical protein
MTSVNIDNVIYGPKDTVPYLKRYKAPYGSTGAQMGFSVTPTITKNRASSTSTNPFRIGNPFSIGNPLQKWRDSAISESVNLAQPLNRQNMQKHNDAVAYINAMNAGKLALMSSNDVAFLAHKMAQNRARHRASTMRKGGGKKKSRKSRKTRRNPIHK